MKDREPPTVDRATTLIRRVLQDRGVLHQLIDEDNRLTVLSQVKSVISRQPTFTSQEFTSLTGQLILGVGKERKPGEHDFWDEERRQGAVTLLSVIPIAHANTEVVSDIYCSRVKAQEKYENPQQSINDLVNVGKLIVSQLGEDLDQYAPIRRDISIAWTKAAKTMQNDVEWRDTRKNVKELKDEILAYEIAKLLHINFDEAKAKIYEYKIAGAARSHLVKELWQDGHNVADIAAVIDVSEFSIKRDVTKLRKQGEKLIKHKVVVSQDAVKRRQRVYRRWRLGMSGSEIAADLSETIYTVNNDLEDIRLEEGENFVKHTERKSRKVTERRNQVKELWRQGKSGPEISRILDEKYETVKKDIDRLREQGEELDYRIRPKSVEVIIFDINTRSEGEQSQVVNA